MLSKFSCFMLLCCRFGVVSRRLSSALDVVGSAVDSDGSSCVSSGLAQTALSSTHPRDLKAGH